MKKGFVISWYYPPGNSSEGLVTYKLLKNSKYKYDVWTRKNQQQNVWDRKSKEDKLIAENVKIIPGDCESEKEWVKQGVQYFLKHRDEYDFIMSRSMPVESHEIAMKIKELFPDIKWIASFGDPIVNTPYIDAITMEKQKNPFVMREYFKREDMSVMKTLKIFLSPARQAKKYLWKRNKHCGSKVARYFSKINDYVIKNADVLIYNNSYQLEHAFLDDKLKDYKEKSYILEHSFDPGLYSAKKESRADNKISFVYVGHLDDTRNARSLFKAIKKLKEHDKDLNNKVSFKFYGNLSNWDKLLLLDNDLTDVVEIGGDIGYLDSLRKIKESDWAILIDANFTSMVDNCIYLPAKLIDYIGARTKIFSISHVKGAGSDIIREVGGGKVVTHSPDDIYLYLSKIIYQGFEPKPYDEKCANRYSSKTIAKRLDEIEDKLLGE